MITFEEYLKRHKQFNPLATREEMAPPKIHGDTDMYGNVDKDDMYQSMEKLEISPEMVKQLYGQLNCQASFDEFAKGISVEREHDDITGGNPTTVAKIVQTHLREDPNYYSNLQNIEEN